jgi:hypothetical protein
MIQEIPYGVYTNNESKENINSESKEIIEMPVSIEVVAHKAIVIYDATAIVNRPSRCHICIFIFFCCIPMSAFLLIVLTFTNKNIYDIIY